MIQSKIQNMCLEEYKIIQAKIDKIGEFKFKVRGWSFTLQSAALAGIFTHDLTAIAAGLFFLSLWFGLFFFNFLEQEQIILVSTLSRRATVLEKTLSRLTLPAVIRDENFVRLLVRELEGTPRIGVTLRNESRRGIMHVVKHMKHYKTNMFFIFQYLILAMATILYYVYFFVCTNWSSTVVNKSRFWI